MATRLNLMDYSVWDVDDVSTWLGQIHLSQLVPNFERLGIMGADLPRLSDQYIRERLRITKPAEVMALKGAISHLVDSAQQKNQPVARRIPQSQPSRKVSGGTQGQQQLAPLRRPSVEDKKKKYNTLGTEKIVMTKQPQLKDTSASELLDDQHRHAGWIRKQGGGYKNWRRRYLILRRGCLYYFTNETASQAKGSFMLTGYKADVCNDPKIVDRFKHCLKLTPMNPAVRTYFMAVGSKRELESWLQAINEEIIICSERTRVSVVPGIYDEGDDEEPDDIDPTGGDSHVYDDPNSDPYEQMGMDGTDVIYDEPPEEPDDDDEDDPYCHIEDHLTSPTHAKEPKLPPPGDGIPVVPERSDISLRLREEMSSKKKLAALDAGGGANGAETQDDTYLRILGPGSEPIMPPPIEEPSNVIQRGGFEIPLPRRAEPDPPKDRDYEDTTSEPDGDGNGYTDDGDDPYYILFRGPDELMPSSCIFDVLERPEADRLLRAKNRNGTYLIRGGAHAGAEKVLSVWQIDRCRHYKLFKDDNNGHYSLTQGQSFKTIPELIQYYSKQAQLPRSDFYLGDPYHPDDH